MLRVSNIAHLLTKPDQEGKAGRLEWKPKLTTKHQVFNFAKTKEKTK